MLEAGVGEKEGVEVRDRCETSVVALGRGGEIWKAGD